MKNIKGIKSFKVLGLAMLFSLGLVGCSQKKIDSNVDKFVKESIGDTTKYELTYGSLDTTQTNSDEGYILKVDSNSKCNDGSNELYIYNDMAQIIANRTNEYFRIEGNQGFITIRSKKDVDKKMEDMFLFLVKNDLIEKFYYVHINEEYNSSIIFLPKDYTKDNLDKIANNIYKIVSKDNKIEYIVEGTKQYISYNTQEPQQEPQEDTSNLEGLNEYQASKVKLSGKNDLKGIENTLDSNLKELLQSDDYKYEVTEINGVVQADITFTDDMYTDYSEADLNKIGSNMAQEGLKDLSFICYKNFVLEGEGTSFNFTVTDNNARIIYHETM